MRVVVLTMLVALLGCTGERVGGESNPAVDGGGALGGDASETGVPAVDAFVPECVGKDTAMVKITAPGGSYCIDVTEVTIGQFDEFLEDGKKSFVAPEVCKGREEKLPAPLRDPGLAKRPRRDVEYCFAAAYCAWAGKRLCARIGGGHAVAGGVDQDPLKLNEWGYACANGGKHLTYPYGTSYDETKCVVSGGDPKNVGTTATCKGTEPPFDAIFDMSGNASELDDYASSYVGPEVPLVHALGGSAASGATSGCGSTEGFGMFAGFGNIGFRCCKDP